MLPQRTQGAFMFVVVFPLSARPRDNTTRRLEGRGILQDHSTHVCTHAHLIASSVCLSAYVCVCVFVSTSDLREYRDARRGSHLGDNDWLACCSSSDDTSCQAADIRSLDRRHHFGVASRISRAASDSRVGDALVDPCRAMHFGNPRG